MPSFHTYLDILETDFSVFFKKNMHTHVSFSIPFSLSTENTKTVEILQYFLQSLHDAVQVSKKAHILQDAMTYIWASCLE